MSLPGPDTPVHVTILRSAKKKDIDLTNKLPGFSKRSLKEATSAGGRNSRTYYFISTALGRGKNKNKFVLNNQGFPYTGATDASWPDLLVAKKKAKTETETVAKEVKPEPKAQPDDFSVENSYPMVELPGVHLLSIHQAEKGRLELVKLLDLLPRPLLRHLGEDGVGFATDVTAMPNVFSAGLTVLRELLPYAPPAVPPASPSWPKPFAGNVPKFTQVYGEVSIFRKFIHDLFAFELSKMSEERRVSLAAYVNLKDGKGHLVDGTALVRRIGARWHNRFNSLGSNWTQGRETIADLGRAQRLFFNLWTTHVLKLSTPLTEAEVTEGIRLLNSGAHLMRVVGAVPSEIDLPWLTPDVELGSYDVPWPMDAPPIVAVRGLARQPIDSVGLREIRVRPASDRILLTYKKVRTHSGPSGPSGPSSSGPSSSGSSAPGADAGSPAEVTPSFTSNAASFVCTTSTTNDEQIHQEVRLHLGRERGLAALDAAVQKIFDTPAARSKRATTLANAAKVAMELPALRDDAAVLVDPDLPACLEAPLQGSEKVEETEILRKRFLAFNQRVQGLGQHRHSGDVDPKVRHLQCLLRELAKPINHDRTARNARVARDINQARGSLKRRFNSKVSEVLNSTEFKSKNGSLTADQQRRAAKQEVLVHHPGFCKGEAGAARWKTEISVGTRNPRAEEALRTHTQKNTSLIASHVKDTIRPHTKGTFVLHNLVSEKFAPIRFPGCRAIMRALGSSEVAAAPAPAPAPEVPAAPSAKRVRSSAPSPAAPRKPGVKDRVIPGVLFRNPAEKGAPVLCLNGNPFEPHKDVHEDTTKITINGNIEATYLHRRDKSMINSGCHCSTCRPEQPAPPSKKARKGGATTTLPTQNPGSNQLPHLGPYISTQAVKALQAVERKKTELASKSSDKASTTIGGPEEVAGPAPGNRGRGKGHL